MSKRLNIATPRKKKDGGTYWVNIGTAWVNDNGQTQLVFDALPLPDAEGRCVANLFEPRERDQRPQTQQRNNYADDDLGSDSIPF